MEGRSSDRPDREHGNPLEPVRTRDDVEKQLGRCDRRRISANFPYREGSISFDSFDFRRIRRYDVTTQSITIEFDIIEHRVLAALGRPLLLVRFLT